MGGERSKIKNNATPKVRQEKMCCPRRPSKFHTKNCITIFGIWMLPRDKTRNEAVGSGAANRSLKAFVIQLEMTEVAEGTSLAMDCKGQARQLEMQPGLWAVVCNQLQLLLLVRPTTAMQGSAAEQKMLLLHTNLLSLGKCRC
ncbi:hypothetical protein Q9966_005426 [Columba livia]|nr:hypothetical protein Q9966_005426 [Columba livia]